MTNPLPIWCVITNKRNTMLAHTTDGPIVFVNEAEALKGIEKIAKRFKLATLLVTRYDDSNAARYAGWDWERADDLKLPAGAITLRHLKDHEAKIREDLAANNGARVVKKPARKERKRATAPAPPPPPTSADDEKQTIAILQQDCRDLGVKFHHMHKAEKLRELLKAAGELATV